MEEKRIEIIIPRKEAAEEYKSDTWLFSRLRDGEIPDSPKYIRKIYDRLVEIKEETKGVKFKIAIIELPNIPGGYAPPDMGKDGEPVQNMTDEESNLEMCGHNFCSICAHVLGHSLNDMGPGKDDDLHIILYFDELERDV